jgi:putative thiamine transport system permease protein
MLRFAPFLTLLVFLAPIGAGVLGTILPAFGYLPVLGSREFSLDPWRALFDYPGFSTALSLTLGVGFGASVISFLLAVGFCAMMVETRFVRRLQSVLPPLLATPHVAIAIGFAFLVAPSGLLVRMISPWATGWDRPPAISTINDAYGLSLIAGLVLKETAYLVLMILAASGQASVKAMLQAARALGYASSRAWMSVVLPQIYPQIRLPIYAVLAFSLSNVEVSLILGPGNPPPLAVVAVRWFTSYDLSFFYPATAAATLQFAIVVVGIALWRGIEALVAAAHRRLSARGARRGIGDLVAHAAGVLACGTFILALSSIVIVGVWSSTHVWRYPSTIPSEWSLATWGRYGVDALSIAGTTTIIAVAAVVIGLILVLACLENEQRRGLRVGSSVLWVLYVPLLIPQIAFLFGAQMLLVRLSLDATLIAVIWAHLLFVLPYVFLSLAEPYRALDKRYARISAALGASPMRTFFAVKLPMLARPIAVACAIGFAVSVALYLPTLFAGAGRIVTLTTEAVTLASGGDRRVIGVFAFIQAVLPLAVYTAALALPAVVFRNRKGLVS